MDLSFNIPVGFLEAEVPIGALYNTVSSGAVGAYQTVMGSFAGRGPEKDVMDGLDTVDQSDFLNWDPKFLSERYAGEERYRLGDLPYSRLVTWSETKNVRLNTDFEDFEFRYRDKAWREAARRGYDAISDDRLIYDNGHAIRLFAVRENGAELDVQKALYTQQAQSNLIADYVPRAKLKDEGAVSLRQMMSRKYPQILPPLDEPRLANTLGVSVLVLCHDDDGLLRPLLQLREAEHAANNNSGVHCTGSRAALWPREEQSFTAESFFDDEAYAAVEKDFDLRRDHDEVKLYPSAIVREHARMGKPQMFYFGYTPKPLDEVLKFRLEQQKEREIHMSSRVDKYRSMTLDEFRKLITTDIWEDRDTYKITQEAYAMLYLMMRDFGER